MAADPYEILDVEPDADTATVRRAYQKLARRFHPDLHPGDRATERRFEEVVQAWEILGDPERRRRWDRGELEFEAVAGERGERWGFGQPLFVSARFDELVGVLVGREEEEEDEAGGDIHTEVTLDFVEAVRGVATSLTVQREERCGRCDADGCRQCGGRGVVVELERLRLRIPPGVGQDSRLRLRGKGSRRGAGGRRGHLYVEIRTRPHPYFRRRGADIHARVPITFAEAALGGEIDVPTLDGPVRVRIPPGTASGQRFRLPGRGVAVPNGPPGHHFYTVEIVPPREPTEKSRRLLRELEQEDPRRGLPREPV